MKAAIIFSFIFIGAYLTAILFNWFAGALFFFGSSPLMVIYVVYKVLRDPKEVEVTFDEHFYQDHPYKRNNVD